MIRGEKPIEPGNSWFSAKSIEVERKITGMGGRALPGQGQPKAVPIPRKLRILVPEICRQTWGAKVQCREGKSPDRTLRSLKNYSVGKEVKKQ